MSSFPETSWTSIYAIADASDQAKDEILARFYRRYCPCFVQYLQCASLRLDADTAEELAHGFVADKILQRRLLEKASSSRGRLRTLLRTSLRNYALNELRRNPKHKHLTPLTEVHDLSPGEEADPFDVSWAVTVFDRAVEGLRAYCQSRGHAAAWRLFEARMLMPLEGGVTVDYRDLEEELGIETVKLHAKLQVTKRRFGMLIREIVSEYSDRPDDVDTEIRELVGIIRDAPAELIETCRRHG